VHSQVQRPDRISSCERAEGRLKDGVPEETPDEERKNERKGDRRRYIRLYICTQARTHVHIHIDIHTNEQTRLWVNVRTRKQSEREWPKLRAGCTGRLRRSIAWVRSILRRRQSVVGDGGFRRGCLLPVFSVVIITVVVVTVTRRHPLRRVAEPSYRPTSFRHPQRASSSSSL